jgi:hypothetical protein
MATFQWMLMLIAIRNKTKKAACGINTYPAQELDEHQGEHLVAMCMSVPLAPRAKDILGSLPTTQVQKAQETPAWPSAATVT